MRVRKQPNLDVPEPLWCVPDPSELRSLRSHPEYLVNAIDDWCIFAPPTPGPGSTIGNTERIEVAWCIKPGYGTRLIPDGAITGAHFVQTPDYVQVTGVGDLTKINVSEGNTGGELDPHGADGNGRCITLFELMLALRMRMTGRRR